LPPTKEAELRRTPKIVVGAFVAAVIATGAAVGIAGPNSVSDTPFGAPNASEPRPGASITAVRGDRQGNWVDQTQSEVLARHGMVATSQPLAADAGLQILKQGGNAADAAVATAAMLGVTEPYSAGLGGDMFVIYYSAKQRRLHGLNASGWAPRSWSLENFEAKGIDEIPLYGTQSVSVPGVVDGWHRLLKRFGTMGFRKVLAPSARTASQGFGLTERIHSDWESMVPELRKDPESTRVFLRGGKAPELYGIFRNPDMAKAYRLLQRQGRDAFYEGPIADAIIERINGSDALPWRRSDLSSFRSEWVRPISTSYKGYDVHQMPPNSQGFATLEMLNILEQCGPRLGYDLKQLGPRSARFWHVLVEAKKLAYSDLHAYNGDPRFVDVPLRRLLSKEYARSLCSKIDLEQAAEPSVKFSRSGDTVYLAVADRWGNMASVIYSIYDYFGSQVTVPGYGFPLNDRGYFFELDADHPNAVAPRKRPFHTIIPAFVTKGGRPLLAFGNMGGDEQPQAQATELVNMIDLGMNVQAAGDAARFHHDQDDNELDLESKLFDLVGPQLQAMGHRVNRDTGDPMGGYQAILFERDPRAKAPKGRSIKGDPPVNGVYRGGTDFRKDGQAAGW
jgi:gamma-glutamyltranspeptidase / glutathione hydrolase